MNSLCAIYSTSMILVVNEYLCAIYSTSMILVVSE